MTNHRLSSSAMSASRAVEVVHTYSRAFSTKFECLSSVFSLITAIEYSVDDASFVGPERRRRGITENRERKTEEEEEKEDKVGGRMREKNGVRRRQWCIKKRR